jgi:hypothetical protein
MFFESIKSVAHRHFCDRYIELSYMGDDDDDDVGCDV